MISFSDIGIIVYLMSKSKFYSEYDIEDVFILIMPPLKLGQYKIYYDEDGNAVSFATWAYLSDDSLSKLCKDEEHLDEGDWNSGDILYISDFCALESTGRVYAKKLIEDLGQNQHGFSVRRNSDGFIRRIFYWKGAAIEFDEFRSYIRSFYLRFR